MAERHEKELSYTPEPAEKALIDALDSAEPDAAAAIEARGLRGGDGARSPRLRAPIDAFFDSVTVNDERPGQARGAARPACAVPRRGAPGGGFLADRGVTIAILDAAPGKQLYISS